MENTNQKAIDLKLTIYPCKFGKLDKTKPLDVTVNTTGNFVEKEANSVIKSCIDYDCHTCSGSGVITVIDANHNTNVSPCTCAYTRFLKSIPSEVAEEIKQRIENFRKVMSTRIEEHKIAQKNVVKQVLNVLLRSCERILPAFDEMENVTSKDDILNLRKKYKTEKDEEHNMEDIEYSLMFRRYITNSPLMQCNMIFHNDQNAPKRREQIKKLVINYIDKTKKEIGKLDEVDNKDAN